MIEQASLVLGNGNWAVKSDSLLGYKTIDGKYYPREMTFTRATTGTRVNEAGLVELVPYNLLLNTNTFSSWNLEGGTLTSGFTAPDGSSTAYKYVPSSGGLWAVLNLPVMSAGTGATQSIWVKSVSGSNVTFKLGSGYSTQGISNKTATSQWQLFTNSFAFSDGGSMYIDTISDAQGIYVWHPQLVEGTEPLDYLPTTDRLDIARIDYSTGSPSLLLEPQRTNIVTYSEQFENTAWSKQNFGTTFTLTDNFTTAPNGTLTACKYTWTAMGSGQFFSVYQTNALPSNQYTFSVYMKGAVGGEKLYIYNYPTYTTQLCTLTTEWQRFSITVTTNQQFFFIGGEFGQGGMTTLPAGTAFIWGAQIEAGSYATSYIPTTSATVTRNGDDITNTFLQSGGFLGSNTGAMFISGIPYNLLGGLVLNFVLTAATNTIESLLFDTSANRIRLRSFDSSSNQQSLTSGTITGNYKLCVSWTSSSIKFFVNGSLIGTISQTTYPYTTIKQESTSFSYNIWGEVVFFPTNIADADAIALTTI